MYKYEMDPTRTVGTTERTQDVGRTEGPTDRRTDGRTDVSQYEQTHNMMQVWRVTDVRSEWNQYTPKQLCCVWGIMTTKVIKTYMTHQALMSSSNLLSYVTMTSSNGNSFRVTGHLCGWVNNREAGDLIRHHAHYDVTVMADNRAAVFIHPVVNQVILSNQSYKIFIF